MITDEMIRQVEEGTGADLALDFWIFKELFGGLFWPENARFFSRIAFGSAQAGPFTTSLDLVVSLIEAKLPGWSYTIGTNEGGRHHIASMGRSHPTNKVVYAEQIDKPGCAPRALLAATLRALQHQGDK